MLINDLVFEPFYKHKPPFVFIDEFIEAKSNYILCKKRFSKNDPVLRNEFSVPGTILLECLAQSMNLAEFFVPDMIKMDNSDNEPGSNFSHFIVSFKNCHMLKSVGFSDELIIKTEFTDKIGDFLIAKGTIHSNGELVFESEISLFIRKEIEIAKPV
ncbi:MAG: hypothetical protein NTZ10_03695 [Candidatus Saganbacteria bacterium]|nr:hypothetical protein [Candidatus Saganbacteria bacterium]